MNEQYIAAKNILGCESSADGGKFVIRIRSDADQVFAIGFSPVDLDTFLTALATIQFDDASMQGPNVSASRIDMVKDAKIGQGQIEGLPAVVLIAELRNGLKRILAFHRSQYDRLAAELAKVGPPTAPGQRH